MYVWSENLMASANNNFSDGDVDNAIEQALASLDSDTSQNLPSSDGLAHELGHTLRLLSLSPAEAEPGAEVRSKLLASLNEVQEAKQTHVDVFSSDGEWKQLLGGVKAKVLFVEPTNGYVTTMLRLDPGASLPNHFHRGNEQCLILEGEFQMYGKIFKPGDFTVALAQTMHEGVFTETGATVLLVAPPDYERGPI